MTITQALDVSQRSVSYREAEIFLAHAIGRERAFLHTHPETELTPEQGELYETCLRRREANEPVAYITGVKEFYGRPFACDKRALIPRPETEGLIDRAIGFLQAGARVLELGTGCGNIATTLALEVKVPVEIIATDLSSDALALAQENWQRLGGHSPAPRWLQADLFDHVDISGQFDLIIANLPYVPDTWKMDPAAQPEVVFQEPDMALFGGPDGLDIYRRFFAEASGFLKADGRILIEYSEDQTAAIHPLAESALPGKTVSVYQDYAGLDRILEIA